jgi:hypothetical protein
MAYIYLINTHKYSERIVEEMTTINFAASPSVSFGAQKPVRRQTSAPTNFSGILDTPKAKRNAGIVTTFLVAVGLLLSQLNWPARSNASDGANPPCSGSLAECRPQGELTSAL